MTLIISDNFDIPEIAKKPITAVKIANNK